MARAKIPQWRKDFNQRMAQQLKLFAKCKETPEHLTKWTYHNGKVTTKQSYKRTKRAFVNEYRWIPAPKNQKVDPHAGRQALVDAWQAGARS